MQAMLHRKGALAGDSAPPISPVDRATNPERTEGSARASAHRRRSDRSGRRPAVGARSRDDAARSTMPADTGSPGRPKLGGEVRCKRLFASVLGLSLLAAACGGDDSGGEEAKVDSSVKEGVQSQLGGSSTSAGGATSTTVAAKNIGELQAQWDTARAGGGGRDQAEQVGTRRRRDHHQWTGRVQDRRLQVSAGVVEHRGPDRHVDQGRPHDRPVGDAGRLRQHRQGHGRLQRLRQRQRRHQGRVRQDPQARAARQGRRL